MPEPRIRPSPEDLLAHSEWVAAIARRLLARPEDAEDAVQQTWVAALEDGPRRPEALRCWLGKVARNFSLRGRRSEKRRARREASPPLPEDPPTPAESLQRAEAHQQVMQAVLALPDPYRSVLLQRYFDGVEPAAIARQLGLAPGTVRSHLSRGLELLRRRLEAEHGGRWRALCLAALPGAKLATAAAVAGSVTVPIITMSTAAKVAASLGIAATLAGAYGVSRLVMNAPQEEAASSAAAALDAPSAAMTFPGAARQLRDSGSAPGGEASRRAAPAAGLLHLQVLWRETGLPAVGSWLEQRTADHPDWQGFSETEQGQCGILPSVPDDLVLRARYGRKSLWTSEERNVASLRRDPVLWIEKLERLDRETMAFSGRAVRADGKALPEGTRVRVLSVPTGFESGAPVACDSGRFLIPDVSLYPRPEGWMTSNPRSVEGVESWRIDVRTPDGVGGQVAVAGPPSGRLISDLAIVLTADAFLRGQVVETGNPTQAVAGAAIVLVSGESESRYHTWNERQAVSDVEGRFEMALPAEERLLAFRVERAGFAPLRLPPERLAEILPDAFLLLRLEPAPMLSGTVVDEEGKPAPCMKVRWTLRDADPGAPGMHRASVETETDAEGRFCLTDLDTGPCTVEALWPQGEVSYDDGEQRGALYASRAREELELAPGERRDLRLRMAPLQAIRGRLMLPGPEAGWSVTFIGPDSDGRASAPVDPSGDFVLKTSSTQPGWLVATRIYEEAPRMGGDPRRVLEKGRQLQAWAVCPRLVVAPADSVMLHPSATELRLHPPAGDWLQVRREAVLVVPEALRAAPWSFRLELEQVLVAGNPDFESVVRGLPAGEYELKVYDVDGRVVEHALVLEEGRPVELDLGAGAVTPR